jgi:S-DNA-T family DNA segregation ATPase FtsK/SpoIIIE
LGSLILFSVALYHLHPGKKDQSAVARLTDRTETVQNWLGKFGAFLTDMIVYRFWTCFPICSIVFLTGLFMVVGISSKKLKGIWFQDLFALIIISILFGFFATSLPELGGTVGYELNLFLQDYIGKTGTLLVLLLD